MDKLKVFISGTQSDMQPERDAVSRAIDNVALATRIRAEETLSRPEPPREWIEQQIKGCNIYLGIYSYRYGWVIPEERISATEFEFNLAHQTGKPILVWIRKLRDAEKDLPDFERQQRFLMRVGDFSRGYMRQEFDNPNELENWIADALCETFVEIITRETMRPDQFYPSFSATLVDAYLTEVANQNPYAAWSDETYIKRSVAKESDPFSRTVTPYQSLASEREEKSKSEPLETALVREGKLVLLGEPGLGKTTSLLHLAWTSANQALGSSNSPRHDREIPIYVELKYYNGEGELETLLAQRVNHVLHARSLLLASDLAESTRILKVWMAQTHTRFLLLLDGLNEVRPELYTTVRGLIHTALNSRHHVVIACRERDYDHSLGDQALAFALERLRQSNIRYYLWRIMESKATHSLYEQILKDPKMLNLAGNPLMLSLIGTIAHANPDVRLPSNRGELFRQFVDLMPRLRTSEGLPAKVALDIVKSALAKLALEMQRTGRTTVDLGELRDWQIPIASKQLEEVLAQAKDWRFLKADGAMGDPVEFLHQLFLEYFAAAYLNGILRTGQGFGVVLGNYVGNDLWSEVVGMLSGIYHQPAELVKWLSEQAARGNPNAAFLAKDCWETTAAISDPQAGLAVVDSLTTCLQDEDPDVRGRAAYALGSTRNPQAIDRLIPALRDKNNGAGSLAAYALSELGALAVSSLAAALQDDDQVVRRRAADALTKIGPPAIESLVGALRDQQLDTRRLAASALGKIGGQSAIGALVAALGNEDAEVRGRAASALGQINDSQALEPLVLALRDKDLSVRWRAAYALSGFGISAVDSLAASARDGDGNVRRHAVDSLARIGAPAVDSLIALLGDGDKDVRHIAALALGKIKDERAIEPLISAINSSNRRVRANVVRALGTFDDSRVIELLIDSMHDDDVSVRAQATRALGKRGRPAVLPLILALRDNDANVRGSAACALGNTRDHSAVEPLLAALGDEEPQVRRDAISSLGKIGDSRAIDSLVATLVDADSDMRERAIIALGNFRDERAMESLAALLQDTKPNIRAHAVNAIGKIPDRWTIKALMTALIDEDDYVRYRAVVALGKVADEEVLPLLERMAHEDKGKIRHLYVAIAAQEAVDKIRNRGKNRRPVQASLDDISLNAM